MRILYTFIYVILFIGCATSNHGPSRAAMNSAENLIISAGGDMVSPTCNDRTVESRLIKGYTFEAGDCGLLYDKLMAGRALEKEICPSLSLKGSACTKKAVDVCMARMGKRYWAVPKSAVIEKCQIDPVTCSSLRSLELFILNAHNAAIEKSADMAVTTMIKDDKRSQEEERERKNNSISSALSGIGQSLQNSGPKTKCTSKRDYLGTVHTECD